MHFLHYFVVKIINICGKHTIRQRTRSQSSSEIETGVAYWKYPSIEDELLKNMNENVNELMNCSSIFRSCLSASSGMN